MAEIVISGRVINSTTPCFVIAEIGHNHQGDMGVCKRIFEAAKECGADAVKLQKRDNKTLYTDDFYNSPYHSENAFGPTYGAHREALEFGRDEYVELKEFAENLGLIFFATAFDIPSAELLEWVGVPCYKIASGDLRNIKLLRHIAKFQKPMIISTGGATMYDVRRAFNAVHPLNPNIALLHCTAMYPITDEHEDKTNLRVIESLRKEFPGIVIGFSDHSNGVLFSAASYVLGARIIERHFTLKRIMKGTDHAFSLEPHGMRKLVQYLKRLEVGCGDGEKRFYEEEKPAIRKMAKTVVAARDLSAGEFLNNEDLALKSPADGTEAHMIYNFVGRRLKVSLKKDQSILAEHVEI